MKRYIIEVSLNARKNINDYIDFIKDEYKSPLTAERHLLGLFDEIHSLNSLAESIPVSIRKRVLMYGLNARSIKYKKMCIIYTVHNQRVIVHELLPSSMITSGL